MAEEIQEAVQIIRVGYDGLESVMKVCGGTLEEMKKALDFLIAVLDREKAMGKTDMRKLLMKGGDMQVFQFPTEDVKKVERMAKKYGILYSVLPDINKEDGMSEIIFHTEAVPRVNMMIEKLKSGRVSTFDDYLKNGDSGMTPFPRDQEKGKGGFLARKMAGREETQEELVERVGNFAMGKESVSAAQVRRKFHLKKARAEIVMWELEWLGVLSKGEKGRYRALMGQEEFTTLMKERRQEKVPAVEVEETAEAFMGLVEEAGGFAAGKESVSVEELGESLGLETERAKTAVWELLRLGALSKGEGGRYKVLMDQEEFTGRMDGYRELARRVQVVAASKDPDLVDITITKKLVAEENGHAIKTRVPGTWGENARYIWLGKDRMMESDDGKSILVFLERGRDYELYAADNSVAGVIKGKDLYEGYYDEVDAKVRERYERALGKSGEREKNGQKKKPVAEKGDRPDKKPARKKKPVPGKGRRP